MGIKNFFIHKWKHFSVTSKFTVVFAILILIMSLVGMAGYVSVAIVRHQMETAILSSTKIQHTVLGMKVKIEEARRLENYFFLIYPTIGLEKAIDQYVSPAEKSIEEVIRLSSELKQIVSDLDVSEQIRRNQVNLNFFLSSSRRHLDRFKEAVVLVSRLANDKTGLKWQLEMKSSAILQLINNYNDPTIMDMYRQLLVLENKYWLERKRYLMQSGFNLIVTLKKKIRQSADIRPAITASLISILDEYIAIAEVVLETDLAIRAKFNEFELQVNAMDPISEELIRLAEKEVQRAKEKIRRTSFSATVFYAVSVVFSIGLLFTIALILHRSVTMKIISLNQTAHEYRQGNLSARPNVDSFDEIGVLTESFISMAEKINDLINGLERKVEEQARTNINLKKEIRERTQAQAARQKLEGQLRQAQKMESLGTLSGGIAHDLNNMLSPILGYAEMLEEELKNCHPQHDWIRQIFEAGLRARNLVQKLLAFGRKQTLEVKELDVNEIIASFETLVRRTIREDIEITFMLGKLNYMALADRGQIEQIIMNLAINAQDAMPEGGALIVETSEEFLDDVQARTKEIEPGMYVMIAISDNGLGMDASVLERIFDPFYTTKGIGKGTGLGLATVYGIVKQHSGSVSVDSQVEKGTSFKVYLPAIQATEHEVDAAPAPIRPEDTGGTEVILVVEDERQVLDMVNHILSRQGYTILSATSAADCKKLLDKHTGPIDLLLTDVVMPGINGKELYRQMSQRYPNIRLLFMSGYTGNVIADKGIIGEGVNFIQKPFSMNALSHKVRYVLDHE